MSETDRACYRLGGQAVIEGVMIKGPRHASVALRKESGEIVISTRECAARPTGPWSWPLMRGLVVFWQTLAIGWWALDLSAKVAGEEDGEGEESPWLMALTLIFSVGMAMGLFFWLPLIATQLLRDHVLPGLHSGFLFNVVDGIIRMAVFILYVLLIGLMPGIRRIFQYHGAEHQMVAAFEKEGSIDPKSAPRYSTLHPRCGTAFLLTVMVVSILFFSLIPPEQSFLVKFLGRLVLLPLIAGTSFELIRLAERPSWRILAWFLAPGLWLQKMTTRLPDEKQVEVAAAALGAVVELEKIPHA